MLCPTCLFVSFLFCQRKVSTDFFKLDALNVAAVDLIGCYWQIWHGTIVKYTKKIAFFSKYITFQKPKKYNELWFSVYFHLAADFVFCQLIFFLVCTFRWVWILMRTTFVCTFGFLLHFASLSIKVSLTTMCQWF